MAAVEKHMTDILFLIVGGSGIGGLILGIYNAVNSAKKQSVEDIKELYRIEKEKRQELQATVEKLELNVKSLKQELVERDELIFDLKDWIERLLKQFAAHAPSIIPEQFIRHHSLRKL
jgi:predicted RNase H-like nuclease (RuvC/YqgF family)